MEARTETVTVGDGTFDMPVWLRAGGRGPAILLIQEIFGVGEYIRAVAEDLAGLGYVAGAPDLFWRLQPHWESTHDEAGIAASIELAGRFDRAGGVADSKAALGHLRGLPEADGGAGVLGFCLGGTLGYLLAAEPDVELDVLLSFYGSAVPDATDRLAAITCPVLFVFGGSDPYIPRDRVALVEAASRGREDVVVHVAEAAGHAFHNRVAPIFHDPEAAPVAWAAAVDFLAAHLPPASAPAPAE